MVEFEHLKIWQQIPLMIVAMAMLSLILLFPIYTSIIPLYYYYQGIIGYEIFMALMVAIIAFDIGLFVMAKMLSKVVKVKTVDR